MSDSASTSNRRRCAGLTAAVRRRADYLALAAAVALTAVALWSSGAWSTITIRIDGVDPISYYSYLHSIFFDGDLDFTNEFDTLNAKVMAGAARSPTGRPVNCFSIGPSLPLAPAYLATHAALLAGRATRGWTTAADGYAYPYRLAVVVMLAFWGGLGLLLTQGFLKTVRCGGETFGRRTALLAVLTVFFGTNLLYYLFPVTLMPHAISFCAVALFLLHYARRQAALLELRAGPWLLSGLLLGLAALMRWQNALFGILPGLTLLVALAGKSEASPRRRGLLARAVFCAGGFGFCAALAFLPQMLAWRAVSGALLTIPQGSGFLRLGQPALLDVLFSTYNGLFTWHPLTALALAGVALALFLSRKRMSRDMNVADWIVPGGLLLVFLAEYYLNASVSDWHGSWGFGMRRFVNCAPIFAFGVAALLQWAAPSRRRRTLLGFVLVVLLVWNLLFLIQCYAQLIPRWRPLNFHEFVTQKLILPRAFERKRLTVAARTLLKERRLKDAISCAELALELEPQSVDALATAARCARDDGAYRRALGLSQRLLAIEERSEHRFALAIAQFHLGYTEDCRRNLERVIKTDASLRERARGYLERLADRVKQ